jgi:hypothetical protein
VPRISSTGGIPPTRDASIFDVVSAALFPAFGDTGDTPDAPFGGDFVALSGRDFPPLRSMRPSQLPRRLKASTGLSPHQYITRMRVKRGKHLLKHTPYSLAEISFRLGFATQSHFTAVFRRYTGVTPRVYRRGFTNN